MILEGDITIPYKWTTGATIGRFLAELRDNARITGARCETCGKVYAPPPDLCGQCFAPLTEWVNLNGEGEVIACSVVERAMPWSPKKPPFTLGLVKLDGADTNIVHIVGAGALAGERVRAVFKQERTGSILDIDYFAPIDEAGQSDRWDSEIARYKIFHGGTDSQMEELTDVAEVFRLMPTMFRKGKTNRQLIYYFSIEGEQWTVFIGPDSCEVKEGKAVENADCFLKTSKKIFLGTISGTYTPSMSDLVMGKIKTNNPMLLQTFREIFAE